MHQLMDESRKMEHLYIFTFRSIIRLHRIFILIPIASQDAEGIFIVNNRTLGRHQTVVEQEFGTKPMHVSHIHLVNAFIRNMGLNTFFHATGSAVCKRQTQHLTKRHSLFVRPTNALGKNLGLATSRRSQHQMVPTLGLYHSLLKPVGRKSCLNLIRVHGLHRYRLILQIYHFYLSYLAFSKKILYLQLICRR